MIKAVVFDLDGVYFLHGTERFIKSLVSQYGISEEAVVKVYLKSVKMQEYKRGLIDNDTFWQYAIQEWNINAKREEIVQILISSYSVNPKIESYVKELKSRGIKTAICTNNFPDRFENLKNKFQLNNHFDVIITSYEEGITKPSEEIFTSLANRISLKPSEIAMSDDREENVEALNKLGFEAFLYQGLDDFISRVDKLIS